VAVPGRSPSSHNPTPRGSRPGYWSNEAPQGFLGRLALGQFAPVVGLAGAGSADLDHGHHVQGVVQLAVSGPGQAVADDLAGGGLQRRGAGVGLAHAIVLPTQGLRQPGAADEAQE
jgi:hypothetical protein